MTDTETQPVPATTNEVTTKVPDEVVSKRQQEACETVIAGIKKLTGRMLKDYWTVGKLIEDIISDQASTAGELKYGKNAISYVAQSTQHSTAELYNMNKVFKRYNEEQIELLTDKGLGITNVVEASKIVDTDKRMKLLLGAAEKETTVKEFKEEVAKAADTKENQKALEAERGEGKKGGGARQGTGPGSSPLTPVKQLSAMLEKIHDLAASAIIGLGADDLTDKQLENMVNYAESAAGVLPDVLGSLIGTAGVMEEFLAMNQGDGRRRRSQGSRKDAYAARAAEFQDFVKGYDKTLVAAEKVRKEMDDVAAKEAEQAKADREKAKEAIRAKAAKPKAEKKTEKKEDKPKDEKKASVSPALAERLAAMRARALKTGKK